MPVCVLVCVEAEETAAFTASTAGLVSVVRHVGLADGRMSNYFRLVRRICMKSKGIFRRSAGCIQPGIGDDGERQRTGPIPVNAPVASVTFTTAVETVGRSTTHV